MARRKNIVIIEDDEDCRLLLSYWLERKKWHYLIHNYSNLKAAFEFIEVTCKDKIEYWPDLILLDLYLPDGYGLDLLDKLAPYCPENPRPKIFIITSSDKMEDVKHASGYDIDAYIKKPLKVKVLDKIFAKYFEEDKLVK
jgi:two-component system CitB family response regulator